MNSRPIALLLAALLMASTPVVAKEYQVTPDRSLDVAAAKLKPGDTLLLKSGTYRQSLTLTGLRGENNRPITLRGEPGTELNPPERDGILIMGEGRSEFLIIDGITVRGARRAGFVINQSRHITVRNCKAIDSGVWGLQTIMCQAITVEDSEFAGTRQQHGAYFSTTDNPVIRRCSLHDNAGCGVHLNGDVNEGGDGIITGAVVEDCRIYANGAAGGAAINMDGVQAARIVNNLIFDNRAGGITSFKINGLFAGDGHLIARNTVFIRSREGRYAVQVRGSVTNVVVTRNVLVAGRGPVLDADVESYRGIRSDENLYYMRGTDNVFAIDDVRMNLARWRERTGQDRGSLVMNPEFKDPGATNFTAQAGQLRELMPIGCLTPTGADRATP